MTDLFYRYFEALDVTIRLFGALKWDPSNELLRAEAYKAKDIRTSILNDLMRAVAPRSFSEAFRETFDGLERASSG